LLVKYKLEHNTFTLSPCQGHCRKVHTCIIC